MWRTEYRCESCKRAVSDHTKMYSNGRCPLCGYKGSSACTMMDVTEHAYRNVRCGPWWAFWKTRREYKEDKP